MMSVIGVIVGFLALQTQSADAALVDHWDFEEGTGPTAADSGIGSHTGTLGAGATWDTSVFHPGADGSTASIKFDGANDDSRVVITGYKGAASILGANDRTVMAWVKTATTVPNNRGILAYGKNFGEQKWNTRLTTQNTSLPIKGQLRTEVNGGYIVGTTSVYDGEWHHIAVVLSGDGTPDVNELSLYVDGSLEAIHASLTKAINTVADIDFLIGDDHSNREWDGWIDDVRVYDEAMSASFIADRASQVVVPEPSSLLLAALGLLGLLACRRRLAS